MKEQLELSQDIFRLVRVGKIDARKRSDDFFELRNLVLNSEDSYPGISKWFDRKVLAGLQTGERTGFVGLVNDRPVAAAVLKKGERAKFCHLRIDEDERSKSLGDLFFLLMALDIRHLAKQVRFTLPESVWESRKSFFKAYHFDCVEKSARQYRLFDTELYSQASFSDVFDAAKQKLPKIFGQLAMGNHSLLTGAVLAIQPEPLSKILSGEKTVEIRTRFSKAWQGRRISLYGTSPISGLAGEAKVTSVLSAHPDKIWELFGHAIGCKRSEYEIYTRDRLEVFAISLSEVRSYTDPISLAQLSHLLGVDLPVPQSYLSLANGDNWLTAVALAAALQGSFGTSANTPQEIRQRHALARAGSL